MADGISASSPAEAVILPYVKKLEEQPAPLDDWGFYEGRPTPPLSPLMPFNTVPWFNRKWMFDKIVPARFGFAQIESNASTLEIAGRSSIVSKYVSNEPSYITDYHLIAIRKQVEQLFAPFFRSKVLVFINDSLHYPPCFMIIHDMYQKSWWSGAEGGNDDGIGSFIGGHSHVFRDDPPTGNLNVRTSLSMADNSLRKVDGSIRGIMNETDDFRSSFGNHYVLSITPRWTITEYWRKMFIETWSDIKQDYQSTTLRFHQMMWGPWSDIVRSGIGFRALAYAMDYGAMWEIEDNLMPEDPAFPEKRELKLVDDGNGRLKLPNGPSYSACSRPYREIGPFFYPGSNRVASKVSLSAIGFTKFQSVYGMNCGIYTNPIVEEYPPPAVNFPSSLESNGKIIYDHGTASVKFRDDNSFLNITYDLEGMEEINISPREQSLAVDGGTYLVHCLGAKITPYYRVKIMSFNGLEYSMDITEREVYYQ